MAPLLGDTEIRRGPKNFAWETHTVPPPDFRKASDITEYLGTLSQWLEAAFCVAQAGRPDLATGIILQAAWMLAAARETLETGSCPRVSDHRRSNWRERLSAADAVLGSGNEYEHPDAALLLRAAVEALALEDEGERGQPRLAEVLHTGGQVVPLPERS